MSEEPEHAGEVAEREERDFRPARWSSIGSLLAPLGLGAFSAFAAATLLGRGDLYGVAFAAIAAWMGWGTFAWYRRWRSGLPAISLGEDGILDATGLGAPTFIPWGDIDSVSDDDSGTTIVLREDSVVKVPFSRRVLHWFTRKKKGEYLLPTRTMDTHHFAISAYVREWHESLLLEKVTEEKRRLTSGLES